MQLPTETGSKKHVIAESYPEGGFIESLSRLFVTEYSDCTVLSVYPENNSKLVAYKILNNSFNVIDPWLEHGKFSKIVMAGLYTQYTLIPIRFAEAQSVNKDLNPEFVLEPPTEAGHLHYSYGLYRYMQNNNNNTVQVFLFKSDTILHISIYKGKRCVFSNYFECHTEHEILYYILSAVKSSDASQEETNIHLSYELCKDKNLSEFLKPYFRTVKHLVSDQSNPDPEIPNLQELLAVNYFLSLCE
jgi:hypothetical protein